MKKTTLTWISWDAEGKKVSIVLFFGSIMILVVFFLVFAPELYSYVKKGEVSMASFIRFIMPIIALVVGTNFLSIYFRATTKGESYLILLLDYLVVSRIVEEVLSNERLHYKKLGQKRMGLNIFKEVFEILDYEDTYIKIWCGRPGTCSLYIGKISDKNLQGIENLKDKLGAEFKPKGA